jgi:hypothetical protein
MHSLLITHFRLIATASQQPLAVQYVNVFHQLLNNPAIPEGDREFTIQLAALFGPTLGITTAALCILLLDATALKDS